MEYLETLNRQHRQEDIDPMKRLRQIPPETGQFLALMAAIAPSGAYLEIGTSGGYSALWISLACRKLKYKLTTFEVLGEKVRLAQETFRQAGVEDIVNLVHGDARDHLASFKDISFCFLDAEKNIYRECYDQVVPRMVSGGLLIADNVISHRGILKDMVQYVLEDTRVDALVLPVGSGELVCRKV